MKKNIILNATCPIWIRVASTWVTTTYYDFDGTINDIAPEGFKSVLTKEQWTNVFDFVKFLGANDKIPDLSGKKVSGKLKLASSGCAFIEV